MRFSRPEQIFPLTSLLLSSLLLSAIGCKRAVAPPPEVWQKYQQDADQLCNAIVDCMKQEVKTRLADHPQRRDMVLKRMDRDLCIKGQYSLIGKLSVDPSGGKPASYREEYYNQYHNCAIRVVAAKDCTERQTIHRTDPSCIAVRKEGSNL